MASLRFSDVSTVQKQEFEKRCRALGIDPDTIQKSVRTSGASGLRVGDPAGGSSFAPANILTLNSVREMKALSPTQDEGFLRGIASDATVNYPAPVETLAMPSMASCEYDVCRLKATLNSEQEAAVDLAYTAYLIGNSTRVQEYEEYIDALHFPARVPVYASQDMLIGPDSPLVIDNPEGAPTILHFGTVTVEPGGQIIIKTPLNLQSQVFTSPSAKQFAADTDTPTVVVTGANGSAGTVGGNGTHGGTGTNAQQGGSSGGKNPTCVGQHQATGGTDGAIGGNGSAGADGSIPAASIFELGDISGNIIVQYVNGRGGAGGAGGPGGNGGDGGAGVAAAGVCGVLQGGTGGNGRNGGNGGAGGKGADGPNITIYYNSIAPGTTFNMDTSSIAGGTGGASGAGGNPGAGGGGQPGGPGESGAPGQSGKAGALVVRAQG